MDKKHQIIIDSTIAILFVTVIILFDHLFVDLRSKPADEVNTTHGQEGQEGGEGREGFYVLEGEDRVFIPILNFHHIDTAPKGASKVAKSFYIEPEQFELILNELLNNDYRPVFAGEIVGYLAKRELPNQKIMAITFDDGNENFYTKAWPILNKYKIKTSVYIMTGVGGANYLTPEQIIELDKSGLVEFGSHTVWHSKLTKISVEEQRRELSDSKEYLEKLLNKKVEILCYPFGLYNDEIKKLAAEVGYKAALTFDQDAWQNPGDLYALTRISVYPELNVLKFLDKLTNVK